jgi:hypothetical protein
MIKHHSCRPTSVSATVKKNLNKANRLYQQQLDGSLKVISSSSSLPKKQNANTQTIQLSAHESKTSFSLSIISLFYQIFLSHKNVDVDK